MQCNVTIYMQTTAVASIVSGGLLQAPLIVTVRPLQWPVL